MLNGLEKKEITCGISEEYDHVKPRDSSKLPPSSDAKGLSTDRRERHFVQKQPYQIVSSIDTLVNRARQIPGVQQPGSLFQRFKKIGTDRATYENQRLVINEELQRLYRDVNRNTHEKTKYVQFLKI